MKPLSDKNIDKLNARKENNAFRSLGVESEAVDFSSNDYLGFSKSETIFDASHQYLVDNQLKENGATGSRLLSGNHVLFAETESMLCEFHESEAALIFNSGYDANIGFFSSVPQRGDIILYDEYIHASIRDGITMSNAKSYKFKHNDLQDLKEKISRFTRNDFEDEKMSFRTNVGNLKNEIYIVTESVFSMDGDAPDLNAFSEFCAENKYFLVVDEAHAIGVCGQKGSGEVQRLEIQNAVFARIITFGKALGCHGAAVLGSNELKKYLINFSRSFIYTTALPPHSLATIKTAYNQLIILSDNEESQLKKLYKNIKYFNSEINKNNLQNHFINSNSAIHCCVISGNKKVKSIAQKIQEKRFDVKAILSPTVPEGQERLRFCLHSYNSKKEIQEVLNVLSTFVN
jgi:8-amino-7-oxononanoate synthase